MWGAWVAAAAAALSGRPSLLDPATVDPATVDPGRVVEQAVGGANGRRVAVVFPDRSASGKNRQATIYMWANDRWCRIGTGYYTRGSNMMDRNSAGDTIRLIDYDEQASDLAWSAGRLVLTRRGKEIRVFTAPRAGCR